MVRLDVDTPTGPARIELHRPRGASALLVLTHGAAGGVDAPDLTAVRDAAVAAGMAVALVTQPFRVAGRRVPPPPWVQDQAWIAIVAVLRRRLRGLPIVVGGRSNGARVACRTAAACRAAAVVALAFPLHPPGRPDKSRLDELDLPDVPVLVIQGDRDPFGMPPPGDRRTVRVVTGAGHSPKKDAAGPAATVVEFVTTTLTRLTLAPPTSVRGGERGSAHPQVSQQVLREPLSGALHRRRHDPADGRPGRSGQRDVDAQRQADHQ